MAIPGERAPAENQAAETQATIMLTNTIHDKAKIAVIMLTVNQRDNTLRCIESFSQVKQPKFHIVLWDNGSEDNTCELVKAKYPDVHVHYHPENLGAAAGRNAAAALAIKSYNPDYLLVIDNDTVVTDNFLEELIKPFAQHKNIGQTAAKIMFLKDKNRINVAGGVNIQFLVASTKPFGYDEIDAGQYDKSVECVAPTCCTLLSTRAFEEAGGFDTIFDPYGYEDLDLSLRIRKAGYSCIYAPDSVIYHDPTQTFESGKYTAKYTALKVRNYRLFMHRHASLFQQAGFYLLGMPYIFSRAFIREAKNNNLASLSGYVKGLFK